MDIAKFLVFPAVFATFFACGEVEDSFKYKSDSSSSPNCTEENCLSSSSNANSSSSFNIKLEWIELDTYYISKNLITQSQYKAVMGINPSKEAKNDTLPVEGVNWFNAVEFCQKLSIFMGLDSNSIKLPTEAEWVYAALFIQRNADYWEWTNDCLGLQPTCSEGDYKVLKGFNKKIDERRGENPYSENVGGYISFRVVLEKKFLD